MIGDGDVDLEDVGDRPQQTFGLSQRLVKYESDREARLDGDRRIGRLASALSDGRLLALPQSARRQWIVAGAETHVCVQQTVFDLLEAGRQVFVVDDAVGSRRPRDKELALQRMQRNGAEIVTREMVLFEWLERAGTPLFKEISKQFIR